jgi:hypothetical protein
MGELTTLKPYELAAAVQAPAKASDLVTELSTIRSRPPDVNVSPPVKRIEIAVKAWPAYAET